MSSCRIRARRHPPSLSSVAVSGVSQPAKRERLKQGVSMKFGNDRRAPAIYLILCVLSAATLAGCGQVGVGSGLATDAPGSGSAAVSGGAPSAPTISGTPAAQAMVGMVYSFQPSTSGASDKALTFSITNKP